MRRAAAVMFLAAAACLACAGAAYAQPTVAITGTSPSDGVIEQNGTAIISWTITSSSSGNYDVEVGGNGTQGTGRKVAASDGSGTFNGTRSGQTHVSAKSDLQNVKGSYTIYVIAVASGETGNSSTTIQVEIPPDQITGLSAGRGDGAIYLGWDASSDASLSYYNIYYGTQHGVNPDDYETPIETNNAPNSSNIVNYTLNSLSNGTEYFIRVSAVDTYAVEGPLSDEVTAIPAQSVGYSGLSNDPGGCFIATAAYGDYDHPMVKNLRGFRDQVLMRSPAGRALVRAYYASSPPLARWLSRHAAARAAARCGIAPLSWMAKTELGRPGAVSIPALLALASALALLARRRGGQPQ